MSHATTAKIDVVEVVEAGPIVPVRSTILLMWLCVAVGAGVFLYGIATNPAVAWGAFYTNLIFWMGLSMGGVVITAIFQIVRAEWAMPIRRIAEANVSFLPVAWTLVLCTYFGKEYLFPWARHPMPGREWWMTPDFVYGRFAVLLGILFLVMFRYIKLSLRSDIGVIQEEFKDRKPRIYFSGWLYAYLARGWKGADKEVLDLQRKLSWYAPVLILLYAVIASLFAFEMIMGMNEGWSSNLFGAFFFVGNIYIAWAALSMTVIYLASRNPSYDKVLKKQQLQDLGNLTFAFTILWGYFFFAQFLCQWYGNLPEETGWLILRMREEPWKSISWLVFSMCFVFPFITNLSRDVPRTPPAFATVCMVIFLGMWLERYVIVMPEISGHAVPFGSIEVALFLGFMGLYVICIHKFLSQFPFVPVSHPLTHGSADW